MSSFEFEFSCRILKSILEFDFSNSRSRILKSNFEFVFFVSSLYSTSRISIRICRRNFRCLALFDFSKLIVKFDFSNFVALFDFSNFDSNLSSKFSFRCSIRLLEFRCSIRLLEVRLLESSALNFEFVLISSTSRIVVEICVALFDFSKSHSSFEFFIELRNFRCSSIKKPNFCAKLQADVANYSRTSASASLSLPRERCARFSCVKY